MLAFALSAALFAGAANAQVTATGTMGVTNPAKPSLGTSLNQTSYSRLLSVNSIDDFCLFAPPTPNSVIGETEAEEVAWCVQPRNNARVIPDGTLTAVHFVRTPLYLQVQGWGDFTKLNIQNGDEGGELDPHGATGLGNPVGGNITSNVTGSDVNYEEWMNYMAFNQFCIRVCIAENSTYSAALECQHTLDEMGCEWVMPGDYTNNSFTSCQADAAYPPGIYPQANGQTSTFAQRYTGTYTAPGGSTNLWTVGQTVTPQSAFSTPASSQCTTYTSIGNGIPLASLGVSGSVNAITGASGSASATGSSMSGSMSGSSMSGSASASATGSAKSGSGALAASASGSASASASSSKPSNAAMSSFGGVSYGPVLAGAFSVVAVLAGAGAILL